MSSEPNKNSTTTFCLTIEKSRISVFSPLLAKGFIVRAQVGCSVRELLCDQFGLSVDYLEKRIQTIFLDGKAVDNVNTTVVHQDSTLALSAAMPGLAGATLRRGGFFAAMRSQITHSKFAEKEIVKDGTIVLKLFNLVAKEIGPMFLARGIWVFEKHLKDFFQKAPDHFWAGCRTAEIDGVYREIDALPDIEWGLQTILFKLRTD